MSIAQEGSRPVGAPGLPQAVAVVVFSVLVFLHLTGCATPQPAATRSIQLELPAMEYAK